MIVPKDAKNRHVSLQLPSSDGNGAISGKQVASQKADSTNCVLSFDEATQTLILDRVDTEFIFDDTKTTPPQAPTSAPAYGNVDEAEVVAQVLEDVGTPNDDNPYDWRHQVKVRRPSTPLPFDPLDLDKLAHSPSPARSPNPPPKQQHQIKYQRRASTPPQELVFDDPEPEPEADEERKEEGDDAGLEIVMDGAVDDRRPKFRGRTHLRPDAPPISFRSATASVSPASHIVDDDVSDNDVDTMELDAAMDEILASKEMQDEPTTETGGGDPMEDDLEAELAKALEAQESSEESEEE
jgi:hypothetical protein